MWVLFLIYTSEVSQNLRAPPFMAWLLSNRMSPSRTRLLSTSDKAVLLFLVKLQSLKVTLSMENITNEGIFFVTKKGIVGKGTILENDLKLWSDMGNVP